MVKGVQKYRGWFYLQNLTDNDLYLHIHGYVNGTI